MNKYKFWIWASIIFQVITGLAHSLSFFAQPAPQNDIEKELNQLLRSYRMDDGFGFHPTMNDLFICLGISYIILYWLGAVLNFLVLKYPGHRSFSQKILGVLAILFTLNFIGTLVFGFIAPVIVNGLVFISQVLCYYLFTIDHQ